MFEKGEYIFYLTMTFQDGGYFDSKSTWVTSTGDLLFLFHKMFSLGILLVTLIWSKNFSNSIY